MTGWRRISGCSLVGLALGCALAAPGQRAAPNDTLVHAIEQHRFEAMIARDLRALDTLLADELTYAHTTGRVDTKASLLEGLRAGRLAYDSISPSDVRVRVYPGAAIATGMARMQVRADGEVRRFSIRFTEMYVERGARWQLVAWQSTRLPE